MYTEYMEMCPACHTTVKNTDYFCFNCGKNLHEKPPSISIFDQALLYAKCIFLPPMGFIWGCKYLKQSDQRTRIVGLVAYAITVIVFIWATAYTMNVFNTVSKQVNTQFEGVGGF